MNKAKVYYITGVACASLWFIVAILLALKIQRHFDTKIFTLNVIVIAVTNFFYNPFLLIGAIFLWRAQKNKTPSSKSSWLIFIIVYIIIIIWAELFSGLAIYRKRGMRGAYREPHLKLEKLK